MDKIKKIIRIFHEYLPANINDYTQLDYATTTAFAIHSIFNQKQVVAVADVEKYLHSWRTN
ncbi:hypothetical protein [Desulfosporosinus metallidurans]|uniref:Uncharacterized protein n=1 Tax=Desulfosporosinus metallidurans TaxID=1888891 RepID=A0A1Q8QWZ3_9FIRM|nr:hypothetical protein [Desulfosporosinus metallidurans]OLN31849.1 hypothetical protein DSOL_2345 [Desulfosporosinus metallidurans]